MKIGIADYGFNVWDGSNFHPEARLSRLKEIGYEGVERLTAISADHAVQTAVSFRKLGMDFATVNAPQPSLTIQWTSAFGKNYVWQSANGRTFEDFCRQVNIQAEACAQWGIRVALHNHMGSLVESQEELEQFLQQCPASGLILDTAHLAAVGGDAEEIAYNYSERLVALHVKDWVSTDKDAELWHERGYFCELGAGNIALNNADVLKAAVRGGYDGWIFVEQDKHDREPLQDLAWSREYLRKAGF